MNKLGERVRKARKEADMTQEELSRAVGYRNKKNGTIAAIEDGTTKWPTRRRKIAKELGIPYDEWEALALQDMLGAAKEPDGDGVKIAKRLLKIMEK